MGAFIPQGNQDWKELDQSAKDRLQRQIVINRILSEGLLNLLVQKSIYWFPQQRQKSRTHSRRLLLVICDAVNPQQPPLTLKFVIFYEPLEFGGAGAASHFLAAKNSLLFSLKNLPRVNNWTLPQKDFNYNFNNHVSIRPRSEKLEHRYRDAAAFLRAIMQTMGDEVVEDKRSACGYAVVYPKVYNGNDRIPEHRCKIDKEKNSTSISQNTPPPFTSPILCTSVGTQHGEALESLDEYKVAFAFAKKHGYGFVEFVDATAKHFNKGNTWKHARTYVQSKDGSLYLKPQSQFQRQFYCKDRRFSIKYKSRDKKDKRNRRMACAGHSAVPGPEFVPDFMESVKDTIKAVKSVNVDVSDRSTSTKKKVSSSSKRWQRNSGSTHPSLSEKKTKEANQEETKGNRFENNKSQSTLRKKDLQNSSQNKEDEDSNERMSSCFETNAESEEYLEGKMDECQGNGSSIISPVHDGLSNRDENVTTSIDCRVADVKKTLSEGMRKETQNVNIVSKLVKEFEQIISCQKMSSTGLLKREKINLVRVEHFHDKNAWQKEDDLNTVKCDDDEDDKECTGSRKVSRLQRDVNRKCTTKLVRQCGASKQDSTTIVGPRVLRMSKGSNHGLSCTNIARDSLSIYDRKVMASEKNFQERISGDSPLNCFPPINLDRPGAVNAAPTGASEQGDCVVTTECKPEGLEDNIMSPSLKHCKSCSDLNLETPEIQQIGGINLLQDSSPGAVMTEDRVEDSGRNNNKLDWSLSQNLIVETDIQGNGKEVPSETTEKSMRRVDDISGYAHCSGLEKLDKCIRERAFMKFASNTDKNNVNDSKLMRFQETKQQTNLRHETGKSRGDCKLPNDSQYNIASLNQGSANVLQRIAFYETIAQSAGSGTRPKSGESNLLSHLQSQPKGTVRGIIDRMSGKVDSYEDYINADTNNSAMLWSTSPEVDYLLTRKLDMVNFDEEAAEINTNNSAKPKSEASRDICLIGGGSSTTTAAYRDYAIESELTIDALEFEQPCLGEQSTAHVTFQIGTAESAQQAGVAIGSGGRAWVSNKNPKEGVSHQRGGRQDFSQNCSRNDMTSSSSSEATVDVNELERKIKVMVEEQEEENETGTCSFHKVLPETASSPIQFGAVPDQNSSKLIEKNNMRYNCGVKSCAAPSNHQINRLFPVPPRDNGRAIISANSDSSFNTFSVQRPKSILRTPRGRKTLWSVSHCSSDEEEIDDNEVQDELKIMNSQVGDHVEEMEYNTEERSSEVPQYPLINRHQVGMPYSPTKENYWAIDPSAQPSITMDIGNKEICHSSAQCSSSSLTHFHPVQSVSNGDDVFRTNENEDSMKINTQESYRRRDERYINNAHLLPSCMQEFHREQSMPVSDKTSVTNDNNDLMKTTLDSYRRIDSCIAESENNLSKHLERLNGAVRERINSLENLVNKNFEKTLKMMKSLQEQSRHLHVKENIANNHGSQSRAIFLNTTSTAADVAGTFPCKDVANSRQIDGQSSITHAGKHREFPCIKFKEGPPEKSSADQSSPEVNNQDKPATLHSDRLPGPSSEDQMTNLQERVHPPVTFKSEPKRKGKFQKYNRRMRDTIQKYKRRKKNLFQNYKRKKSKKFTPKKRRSAQRKRGTRRRSNHNIYFDEKNLQKIKCVKFAQRAPPKYSHISIPYNTMDHSRRCRLQKYLKGKEHCCLCGLKNLNPGKQWHRKKIRPQRTEESVYYIVKCKKRGRNRNKQAMTKRCTETSRGRGKLSTHKLDLKSWSKMRSRKNRAREANLSNSSSQCPKNAHKRKREVAPKRPRAGRRKINNSCMNKLTKAGPSNCPKQVLGRGQNVVSRNLSVQTQRPSCTECQYMKSSVSNKLNQIVSRSSPRRVHELYHILYPEVRGKDEIVYNDNNFKSEDFRVCRSTQTSSEQEYCNNLHQENNNRVLGCAGYNGVLEVPELNANANGEAGDNPLTGERSLRHVDSLSLIRKVRRCINKSKKSCYFFGPFLRSSKTFSRIRIENPLESLSTDAHCSSALAPADVRSCSVSITSLVSASEYVHNEDSMRSLRDEQSCSGYTLHCEPDEVAKRLGICNSQYAPVLMDTVVIGEEKETLIHPERAEEQATPISSPSSSENRSKGSGYFHPISSEISCFHWSEPEIFDLTPYHFRKEKPCTSNDISDVKDNLDDGNNSEIIAEINDCHREENIYEIPRSFQSNIQTCSGLTTTSSKKWSSGVVTQNTPESSNENDETQTVAKSQPSICSVGVKDVHTKHQTMEAENSPQNTKPRSSGISQKTGGSAIVDLNAKRNHNSPQHEDYHGETQEDAATNCGHKSLEAENAFNDKINLTRTPRWLADWQLHHFPVCQAEFANNIFGQYRESANNSISSSDISEVSETENHKRGERKASVSFQFNQPVSVKQKLISQKTLNNANGIKAIQEEPNTQTSEFQRENLGFSQNGSETQEKETQAISDCKAHNHRGMIGSIDSVRNVDSSNTLKGVDEQDHGDIIRGNSTMDEENTPFIPHISSAFRPIESTMKRKDDGLNADLGVSSKADAQGLKIHQEHYHHQLHDTQGVMGVRQIGSTTKKDLNEKGILYEADGSSRHALTSTNAKVSSIVSTYFKNVFNLDGSHNVESQPNTDCYKGVGDNHYDKRNLKRQESLEIPVNLEIFDAEKSLNNMDKPERNYEEGTSQVGILKESDTTQTGVHEKEDHLFKNVDALSHRNPKLLPGKSIANNSSSLTDTTMLTVCNPTNSSIAISPSFSNNDDDDVCTASDHRHRRNPSGLTCSFRDTQCTGRVSFSGFGESRLQAEIEASSGLCLSTSLPAMATGALSSDSETPNTKVNDRPSTRPFREEYLSKFFAPSSQLENCFHDKASNAVFCRNTSHNEKTGEDKNTSFPPDGNLGGNENCLEMLPSSNNINSHIISTSIEESHILVATSSNTSENNNNNVAIASLGLPPHDTNDNNYPLLFLKTSQSVLTISTECKTLINDTGPFVGKKACPQQTHQSGGLNFIETCRDSSQGELSSSSCCTRKRSHCPEGDLHSVSCFTEKRVCRRPVDKKMSCSQRNIISLRRKRWELRREIRRAHQRLEARKRAQRHYDSTILRLTALPPINSSSDADSEGSQ